MISLLFGIAYFGFVAWFFRAHRAVFLASAFLLFSFSLRVAGTVYIDLYGPIFATELGYDVGPGESTPLFVLCIVAALTMFILMQRKIRIKPENVAKTPFGMAPRVVLNIGFAVCTLVVTAIYVDMLMQGVVPLFVGMDRLEYKYNYAGPLYDIAYENCMLLSLMFGFFFAFSRIKFGRYDYRFVGVALALFVYFALTGNRFSIFYLLTGYFAIPMSGVYLLRKNRLLPDERSRGGLHKLVTSKAGRWLVAWFGIAIVLAMMFNNFFNVRYDPDKAPEAIFQRTLVQPSELYFVTWQRMAGGELGDSSLAWELMFGNPLDATRNTGIQYLMVNALGENRAMEILDAQAQYAGGYPEVLIELFGVPYFFVALLLMAGMTGFMYRLAVMSAANGRFLSAFLSVYLLFGFNTFYIGGMLNFLLPVTFWVKIAVLSVVLIVEPLIMQRPRQRLPVLAMPRVAS